MVVLSVSRAVGSDNVSWAVLLVYSGGGRWLHQVGLIHWHEDNCITKSYGASLQSGEAVAYACRVTGSTSYSNDVSLGTVVLNSKDQKRKLQLPQDADLRNNHTIWHLLQTLAVIYWYEVVNVTNLFKQPKSALELNLLNF